MTNKAVFYNEDMDIIPVPFVCYVDAGMELVAGVIARCVANYEMPIPTYVEVQELGTGNTVSLWSVKEQKVNHMSDWAHQRYSTPMYAVATSRDRKRTNQRTTVISLHLEA